MGILKFYEKFGGKAFYECSINKSSFWRMNYAFTTWLYISSVEFLCLLGLNEFLLGSFEPSFCILNSSNSTSIYSACIKLYGIYFAPFGIFNYFFFIRKKRYIELMNKYKDEDKKIISIPLFSIIIFFYFCLFVCYLKKTA